MGDGYAVRLPRRWRTASVVLIVLVLSPALWIAGSPPRAMLAGALIVVHAAAFWWLGEQPWPATAVLLAASAALQVLIPTLGPGLAFVVVCTVAWLRPARDSLWVLAATVAAACVPALIRGDAGLAAIWAGASVLAWSWGALGRARGARRAAEQRRMVLEERARIARELHDVLSHTVSVMVVQAAAADDVFDIDPVRAREALRRTEQTGREALAELRGFLRSVRADEPSEPADQDEPAAQGQPQPTLADVDRLAETIRSAGLPVAVRREGSGDIPAGVQLCAYRIVQEALTNTLRHARAGHAEVLLEINADSVRVEVRDNGRGSSPSSSARPGHGLTGMRERAALFGGTVTAESLPGGGFGVSALLPCREPAA